MSAPQEGLESLENYDRYISGLFAAEDDVLRQTRAVMEQEGLRPIQVSAASGQLLHLLALAIGARRVLEIGALGGYSAIWLGRALPPDGKLITLDRKVKGIGGKLRFCSIRSEILEVFRITRLDRLFTIKDNQEQALDGF